MASCHKTPTLTSSRAPSTTVAVGSSSTSSRLWTSVRSEVDVGNQHPPTVVYALLVPITTPPLLLVLVGSFILSYCVV